MLDITFRNLDSSVTIYSLARELLSKLARHGEPMRCHLVLEDTRGAHAHSDSRFATHLDLRIAHADMSFRSHGEHADAQSAVREAFERVEHQLDKFTGRRDSLKRAERD